MYVTLRFLYCSLFPQFDDENQMSFTDSHCQEYLWFSVLLLQLLIFCLEFFWLEFFNKFNVLSSWLLMVVIQQLNGTAQKMNFSITDFFSKCDQIRSFLTHENTVDNCDLPLSLILLVFFYHEHIADVEFHCFFFMTKVMVLSLLLWKLPNIHEPIFFIFSVLENHLVTWNLFQES